MGKIWELMWMQSFRPPLASSNAIPHLVRERLRVASQKSFFVPPG